MAKKLTKNQQIRKLEDQLSRLMNSGAGAIYLDSCDCQECRPVKDRINSIKRQLAELK